ncbi:hypothetical protein ACFL2H_05655, partial [Planctomycetota bacterium]
VNIWVHELAQTWIGDVNIDGEFNSEDLVLLFQKDRYESGNLAQWSEGDWNVDGQFTSSDLVAAFQDSGFEQGRRIEGNAVPEPSPLSMAIAGISWLFVIARRRPLNAIYFCPLRGEL